MNHEMQQMVAETVQRLFGDLVTPAALEAFVAHGSHEALWQACTEAGLDRATAHENHGGIGAAFTETAAVLHAVGYHAAPVPLADNLVAHALLADTDIAPPESGILVPLDLSGSSNVRWHQTREGQGTLTATVSNVPWGQVAHWGVARVASPEGCHTVLVNLRSAQRTARPQMAHEPHADLQLEGAQVVAAAPCADVDGMAQPRLLGALARSAQIEGAMERVLSLGVAYANERVQFGKPIGQNQAIQHSLATVGGQVAAARTAVRVACGVPRANAFDIAVAKVRAGEAAGIAAATVHQVHGAIGVTAEHMLHHFTQRLWSWRAEYGSDAHWARELGRWAIAAGPEALWPALVARRAGAAKR